MKILGYCMLWAIVLALLVSMCVILKDGRVHNRNGSDSDTVTGKVIGHESAPSAAQKRISHAALSSV